MTTDASPDDRRALLHSALAAIDDLQSQLDAERARGVSDDPVAIVGMSCRFPGGANTPEAYWELLRDGRDVVSRYPTERRHLVEAGGVDLEALGVEPDWYGGFLDDIDRFEPQFFGISPREAATMDPQQRLVLEVGWEALERAGIAPDSLVGSATGVFVGITGNEYVQLAKLGGGDSLDVYSATGGALNAAPGRLAYTLGLQGPCMAIDTACSSSLVALHQAARSLRSGESDLALAGGVNVLLLPEAFICFDRWGMMAPDGRCKTFDASADGFVRGEGCGIVVLKRLRDAEAEGDQILAVMRGSAVNQDGRSSGLTVPSGLAQQALLRAALTDAGVAPADVQYFEAHGTGTTLGDPIEIEAMGAVLGTERPSDRGVVAGSVKTNLGHLESASGIAGVIKVVLSMQHGEIPPHLHFQEPSPQIPWPPFPVHVPTEVTPWAPVDGRRLAGVSGFGFSGTNAHIVLEGRQSSADPTSDAERPHVVTLSARDTTALGRMAGEYASWIDEHPEISLADIATTTHLGRADLTRRLAVVAASRQQLVERLGAYASDPLDPVEGVSTGSGRHPRIAFLFTGQGAQYPEMTRHLYDDEPVFRDALDRCATLITPSLPTPLLEVLFAPSDSLDAAALDETRFTQPALFAVEYALAELWASWGIRPDAMVGHSIGEIAAAAVAGVFALDDAVRLVVARGTLMQALPGGGAMVSLSATADDVAVEIAAFDDVAVAAVNGPTNTVISGAAESVHAVTAVFDARGVRTNALVVSHAFHSPLMRPMLDDFRRVAAQITYRPPDRRIVSTVTGDDIGAEIASADYWVDHVMAPVAFADAMQTLTGSGIDAVVEIGPHPVLTALGRSCVSDGDVTTWAPSLRRNHDDTVQMLTALAELHVAGATVDWGMVRSGGRRRTLPTYPFQRSRCWLDPAPRRRRPTSGEHPLVMSRTPAPTLGATIDEALFAADSPAWLSDHRLSGTIVFPGTAYAELVLAAVGGHAIDWLTILEPLIIGDDSEAAVQMITTHEDGGRAVQIISTTGSESADVTTHARAFVTSSDDATDSNNEPGPEPIDLDERVESCPEPVDVDDYYEHLRSIGLTYGPAFRGLTRLHRRDGAAIGLVELPDEVVDGASYRLHPALLDACFHVLGAAVVDPGDTEFDDMYIPVSIGGLRLRQTGSSTAWCTVTVDDEVRPDGSEAASSYTATVELHDAEGARIGVIDRLEVRRTPRAMWERALGTTIGPVYAIDWSEVTATPPVGPARHWVLIGDGRDLAERLGEQLGGLGASWVVIDDTEELGTTLGATHDVGATGIVDVRGLDADARGDHERLLGGALRITRQLAHHVAGDTRLWFVTSNAQSVHDEATSAPPASLSGFARVVANEFPALTCTTVDIDGTTDEHLTRLATELVAADREDQLAIRSGRRLAARLMNVETRSIAPTPAPYRLELGTRGSFEALADAPLERRAPGPGEVEIEVRATGLNFRDVLNVLGMFPGDPGAPGLECAGVVTAVGADVTGPTVGASVVGIAPNAFDSHVITSCELVVEKPTRLSFAQAATLPVAYLTAIYGLRRLADLRAGERVLIHAGAGGVGMAAIHLAQRLGAEVFTTVGSPAKREVMAQLGVDNVYNSRTLGFADQILVDTDGEGVDVVLNSLSDDFIDASFRALSPTGRFLEIGKRGIWSDERAQAERPDGRYHVYDLADLLGDEGGLHEMLREVVDDIEQGVAEPLPLRAFGIGRLEQAFRFMAQARHIGKVVVTHEPVLPDGPVRHDGAYLVTGGLGGLGLHVATWLRDQGARHITLAGRSAPSSEASDVVAELRASGATVDVVAGDVSVAADVARMIAAATADGSELRGVFHTAGVNDDGAIGQQTWERFEPVLAAKAIGAAVLDRATRAMDLDHFVLFSSASAVLGAPGQSNYAAANSALDAIAHGRRAAGSTALSIGWGAWAGAGMVSRLDDRQRDQIEAGGMRLFDPDDAIEIMSTLLSLGRARFAVLDADWTIALRDRSAVPPLLSALTTVSPSAAPAVARRDVAAELAELEIGERYDRLSGVVAEQVTAVLGLDPSEAIDPTRGFSDLGMDSLMAVELSNQLAAVCDRTIPSTTPFEYPTLDELVAYAADLLADRVEFDAASNPSSPLTPDVVAAPLPIDGDVEHALLRELDDAGY